jgi:hephaestin
VFNEESSPFYESNAAAASSELAALHEDERQEGNKKYSINGFLYCNIPGLNMTVGDRWEGPEEEHWGGARGGSTRYASRP